MTQGSASQERRRYWLLTSPRTASNLLVKVLNLDEQGVRPAREGGYFFLPSIGTRLNLLQKPMEDWTEEECKDLEDRQKECLSRLEEYIAAADEEGQLVYVKEHAIMLTSAFYDSQYTYGTINVPGEPKTFVTTNAPNPTRSSLNLTFLPDEFLKIWSPTFLIRHPAMQLPSLFRTCLTRMEMDGFSRWQKEPLDIEVTMKWFRAMYDFYVKHFGEDSQWPIVLDADDIMTSPNLVSKYAALAGLNQDKLRFSWDKANKERLDNLSSMEQRMLSTINASSKVDPSKVAGNIDIDDEAAKWRSEFGEEGGRKLEQWVRDAMPDYTFLHSKRLRAD
ncbi:hypothetical protein LCI18_003088 [Fusarium solani-melongenae]|uniref:Uncharacterized protein n=1 Tax=Fusarium solani subsp. cucurbitae TaxID=2747967 RepID=A0ACD3YT56_FUSSC|nr:hypothetical protein LCI18_003088 [Fusarium solani-melongenae]